MNSSSYMEKAKMRFSSRIFFGNVGEPLIFEKALHIFTGVIIS
jgi:hypothetical protein